MLLKKQTVWLLTMLSLVVVLSVYYITSPEQKVTNMANINEKINGDSTTSSEDGKTVLSKVASDEEFEALRLDLEDKRSELKEQLTQITASTDLSPEEISKAYDQIKELSAIEAKEAMLETLIKTKGYDDALVRADGNKVRVTVKSKDSSASAANEIIQLVREEIGDLQKVVIEFQPIK
jgi:stage III sporulation protein AH